MILTTFLRGILIIVFGMTVAGHISGQTGGIRITTNERDSHDGYDYEFWTDSRGAGSGSMTLTDNGTFICEWRNTYNILFRMGKKYYSTQRHDQLGNFVLEYGISEYNPIGTSYVTVYGWTTDPLVEFYIIENWGPNNYKGYSAGTHIHKGTITIDGDTYDIYESTRTNQPSILGNRTFKQYWSIRRTRRSEGTISISEHFKAWQEAGLNMNGNMYEVAFCIEAFGGSARNASGRAIVHKNKLTVNGVEVNAR